MFPFLNQNKEIPRFNENHVLNIPKKRLPFQSVEEVIQKWISLGGDIAYIDTNIPKVLFYKDDTWNNDELYIEIRHIYTLCVFYDLPDTVLEIREVPGIAERLR